jgi:hypothetical protein
MGLIITPTKSEFIIPRVREHFTPIEIEIMTATMDKSQYVWIVEIDGEVVAIFGTWPITLISDVAYLWLYTLPSVKLRPITFARHSRDVTAALLLRYSRIMGHCLKSATNSQRWLRWCGATFHEPIDNVIPFEIVK